MDLHDHDHHKKAGGRSHLKKDVKKEKEAYHIPISSSHEGDKVKSRAKTHEKEEKAIIKPEQEKVREEISEPPPETTIITEQEEKVEDKPDKGEEIQELQERIKRISADFENFRRRKEEEVQSAKKYASERIIVELLSVVDNFERALASSQETKNFDSLLEGLQIIYKQMKSILEKEGLVEIQTQGEIFDPSLHQAVMMVESDELPDESIVEELQKGYKLKDRVIRPSMVKVSRKTQAFQNQ